MKRSVTIAALLFLFLQVLARQKNAVAVSYEFPSEMPEQVKAEYIKLWQRGKILYELSCAGCHNKVVDKTVVIPDFTTDQLRGYELRVANREHETNMPDEKVTEEELVLISTFLIYKKKNQVGEQGSLR